MRFSKDGLEFPSGRNQRGLPVMKNPGTPKRMPGSDLLARQAGRIWALGSSDDTTGRSPLFLLPFSFFSVQESFLMGRNLNDKAQKGDPIETLT
jgi:hypothetical protein